MEDRYTILSLAPTLDIEFDFPILKWKKRLPEKIYEYYLLKKLPINHEEVFYMGEPGNKVFLPFTKELLNDKQVLVNRFIKKLIAKHELGLVMPDKALSNVTDLPYLGCPWMFHYLLFPQLLEQIVETYQIDCKYMKLVLIDSGDNRIEYILELLLPHLNYLTIVTNRPYHFNDFVEYALDYTGLAVEILESPLSESLTGDFIIHLGKSNENDWFYSKEFMYLEKHAIVLLMDPDMTKIDHVFARRKDLKIIYDTVITSHGTEMNKELCAEILCKLNWRLKLFATHEGSIHYLHEVPEILKRYPLELKEIIALQSHF